MNYLSDGTKLFECIFDFLKFAKRLTDRELVCKLSKKGDLSVLKKDLLLDWSDNVRIHKDWLYIAVNQLHKSPAFTGGEETAKSPYRILRLKFR